MKVLRIALLACLPLASLWADEVHVTVSGATYATDQNHGGTPTVQVVLPAGSTLLDALAAAGGCSDAAILGQIRITRMVDGASTTYLANALLLIKDPVSDFVVSNDDNILVPAIFEGYPPPHLFNHLLFQRAYLKAIQRPLPADWNVRVASIENKGATPSRSIIPQDIEYSVAPDQRFTTPEAAITAFLFSIKRGDIESALNCFDFAYAYIDKFTSVGLPPEKNNERIAAQPEVYEEKGLTIRKMMSERLAQNLERLKTASSVAHPFITEPQFRVFVVQYTLPSGEWERPQITVVETRKGWRLTHAAPPKFKAKSDRP